MDYVEFNSSLYSISSSLGNGIQRKSEVMRPWTRNYFQLLGLVQEGHPTFRPEKRYRSNTSKELQLSFILIWLWININVLAILDLLDRLVIIVQGLLALLTFLSLNATLSGLKIPSSIVIFSQIFTRNFMLFLDLTAHYASFYFM